jgi:hypothetical protein
MAALKIGLTSGSLITMLMPSSSKEITINYKNKINELETVNNQLVIRLTAHNRRQFQVNWVNINKTQLDTILSYCNGTLPLWVRLEDDFIQVYDAQSYIISDDYSITTNTSSFLYDLSVIIKQLF